MKALGLCCGLYVFISPFFDVNVEAQRAAAKEIVGVLVCCFEG